jgi:hypothetical protein
MFHDILSMPQNGVRSAVLLPSTFEAQVKIWEKEIDNLGEDGLAQLETDKMDAAKKKKAVLKALQQLEEED